MLSIDGGKKKADLSAYWKSVGLIVFEENSQPTAIPQIKVAHFHFGFQRNFQNFPRCSIFFSISVF